MTALLDLPQVRERVSPISVAQYHQLGEFNANGRRTELIQGIILEKMSKSPLHFKMIDRLREILASQIQPGWLLRQEGPLTLATSEPEPDLALVHGLRGDYDLAHPSTAALIIEVAVTSLEIDRLKALIYAEAGVQEYWIVCPNEKQVEVYRDPRNSEYIGQTRAVAPATLESSSVVGVRVDLAALFA